MILIIKEQMGSLIYSFMGWRERERERERERAKGTSSSEDRGVVPKKLPTRIGKIR